jgi:hypothetical protein
MTTSPSQLSVPSEFLCPITKKMMVKPMMSKSGYNFERDAIITWVNDYGTCPLTRQSLHTHDLITNHSLKQKIQFWCQNHNVEYPSNKAKDSDDLHSSLHSASSKATSDAEKEFFQRFKSQSKSSTTTLTLQEAAMMLPIFYETPAPSSHRSNPRKVSLFEQIEKVLVEL